MSNHVVGMAMERGAQSFDLHGQSTRSSVPDTNYLKDGQHGPRILSLCCLYPNLVEPRQGLFVQRRLQHLAELADVRVIAPFAMFQYGNPKGKRIWIGSLDCPTEQQDGKLCVMYPRWFYPPLGGSLTAACLFLQLIYPLARLRKTFRFDVLDTHFGHPEGVAGALLSSALGVPFTMTLRGNEPKHSRSPWGRYCMSFAVRRASRVFAVSERLRQFAIGLGAKSEKVKTIPNGIDTETFYPRDRAAWRTNHGFVAGQPLIVSAGALVERKGHHRVIQALKAMSGRPRSVQLAIVGGPGPEGQYETKIRKLVSDLNLQDVVRFLGAVAPETMAEVMSAADVVCLASTNEGWPNVVHEALACGTPVVATNVGAVPEMLSDGRYGVIVPPNDQPALQNGLEEALRTRWDRAAIAAWGQARSWHHVAAEVFEQMQGIVAEGQKRRMAN
jgi:teichuronic acid biosynthesis glycosyltransferase TuaC